MVHTGKAPDVSTGEAIIRKTLEDGTAATHFQQMMVAQGVDAGLAEKLMTSQNPAVHFDSTQYQTDLVAPNTGSHT